MMTFQQKSFQAIQDALPALVNLCILDEIEETEHARRLPKGKSINQMVDKIVKKYNAELVGLVSYILGGTNQAWGVDPFLLFHHMGLEEPKDLSRAVYLLVMSTFGHGICLTDDWSEQWEQARRTLIVSDDPSPLYIEQCNMTQIFEEELPYVGNLN